MYLSIFIIVTLTCSFCTPLKDFFKQKIKEEQPPGTTVLRIASPAEISRLTTSNKDDPGSSSSVYQSLQTNSPEFSLLDSLDARFFSIDKHSSVVMTQTRLDRESLCSDASVKHCCYSKATDPELCILQFQVTTKTSSEIFLSLVLIEVLDLNDNTPTFQRTQQTIFLKENTKIGDVYRFQIRDNDSPTNSIKKVVLKSDSRTREYFNIRRDKDQARLMLMRQLDRENLDYFHFIIYAYDGGKMSHTGSISVHINVTDVNDNSPRWLTEKFDKTIPEDTKINTVILKLEASDKDAGSNGKITYEYDYSKSSSEEIRWRSMFVISSTSGEIKLQHRLDYESMNRPEIELFVVARDNGEDVSHSVSACVKIRVTDVNDSPPNIRVTPLSVDKVFRVKENTDAVQRIGIINVNDADSDQRGEVTCDIEHGMFRLMPMNNPLSKGYYLIAQGRLDREKVQSISVRVFCEDHGIPSLTSTRNIKINVMDLNDNAPKFTHPTYQFLITENNAIGQYINRVNATDLDTDLNGQVVYNIDEDAKSIVNIHPYSGVLSANKEFDREDRADYSFMVYAKDSGRRIKHSASVSVRLTIKDANDHSPVFVGTNFFNVRENVPTGTVVGTIQATDADSGANGRIRYRIQGRLLGNRDNQSPGHSGGRGGSVVVPPVFAVESHTGRIVLQSLGGLDREQVGSYELRIVAEDMGIPNRRSSESLVHIVVEDENDNPPKFIFPNQANNQINVSCGDGPTRVVTRIQANDSDSGQNAELTYLILPSSLSSSSAALKANNKQTNDNKSLNKTATKNKDNQKNVQKDSAPQPPPHPSTYFDINGRGGELFLLSRLPNCKRAFQFKLPLRVIDHGTPALKSTAHLIINVLPDNLHNNANMNNNGIGRGHYADNKNNRYWDNRNKYYHNNEDTVDDDTQFNKRNHWTAIISLIIATAVLISLLFIILCLLRRRYLSSGVMVYGKGRNRSRTGKPDFSHVVERPGINNNNQEMGKITSDDEDNGMIAFGGTSPVPTTLMTMNNSGGGSNEYRGLSGTYVGFPGPNVSPNSYYTIGMMSGGGGINGSSIQKVNNEQNNNNNSNNNSNKMNNYILANSQARSTSPQRELSPDTITIETLQKLSPNIQNHPHMRDFYQTLNNQSHDIHEYSPLSSNTSNMPHIFPNSSMTTVTKDTRNSTPPSSTPISKVITFHNPISRENISMTTQSTGNNSSINTNNNQQMSNTNNNSNNSNNNIVVDTIPNPMVSTYCSVSFV